MLILLEGVDCSGKTTIGEELAKNLGSTTVWIDFHDTTGISLRQHYEALQGYSPASGRSIICDRYHWSEEIYGPLYRGKSLLNSPAGLWFLDAYIQSRGGVMVLVETDARTHLDRLEARGEDFLQMDDVHHVFAEYRRLERESHCGPIRVPSPANGEIIEALLKLGEVSADEAAPIYQFPEYVGPIRPELLLVGDVSQLPEEDTDTAYLIESVVLKQSDPSAVGLVPNVRGIKLLHERLYEPPTVALGRDANTLLRVANVEHGTVPHPEWWRTTKPTDRSRETYRKRVNESLHSL